MQSFLNAVSFSVLASPIQHVSVKLLKLHHGYAEKTFLSNTNEYFQGQHDYKLKKPKEQCVNKQVSSASEAQNLETEEVILCSLVSAATHQRVV